jgi:predicted Co/Zn/Cd cation transporter (cation efflux family)
MKASADEQKILRYSIGVTICVAIGGEGRERWLTVAFTANEQWI